MNEIQYRLSRICDVAYESCCRCSEKTVPFFKLLDLCKETSLSIDAKFFIEADLENVDVMHRLFLLIMHRWENSFNQHMCCYDMNVGKREYATLLHLFEHEDFLKMFPTFTDVSNVLKTLIRDEDQLLGHCGYDSRREQFDALHEAIEHRLSVSYANE